MKSVCCVIASVLLAALVFSSTGIAVAEDFDNDKNSILKGKYDVSINIYCVSAFPGDDGFEEDLTLINGGFTHNIVSHYEYIFNGDGTGSGSGNWMSINNGNVNPGQRPVNYGTVERDFTYEVNMDRTFEFSQEFTSVQSAFSSATATIVNNGTSSGVIGIGNKTFKITDINPTIEIITYPSFPNFPARERICNRTVFGIKIQ